MTRIRVRLGHAEAEVEADAEHIRDAIELVPELAAKLPRPMREEVAGQNEPGDESQAEVPLQSGTEFPAVTLQKGDSLADVIGKFFSSPWGREKRKLSDVREALQSYGLNYPKQSVAVALLRLAKTTKLRRFKAEDGEYVYTSALNVPSVHHVPEGAGVGELAAAQPG
ncbi:MAG TPA: hypothetical protein VED22_05915 [Nitrososphaerales archaeon]|nr:hypothetical protein [Nitrososphaerales archaeon]